MFDTPNHQIRSLLAAFEASVGASFRSIAGVATPSVPSGRDHRNAKGHTSEVPFVQDAKGQQVDRSSSKLHFIKIKGDAIYIYIGKMMADGLLRYICCFGPRDVEF